MIVEAEQKKLHNLNRCCIFVCNFRAPVFNFGSLPCFESNASFLNDPVTDIFEHAI